MPPRTFPTSIRLTDAERKQLRAYAREEKRTLAGMISAILAAWIKWKALQVAGKPVHPPQVGGEKE